MKAVFHYSRFACAGGANNFNLVKNHAGRRLELDQVRLCLFQGGIFWM